MTNNFQKTVDLKEKLSNQYKKRTQTAKRKFPKKQNIQSGSEVVNADGVDLLFNQRDNDLHKIKHANKSITNNVFGKIMFFLFIMVIVIGGCAVFLNHNNNTDVAMPVFEKKWYAVKLVNGEMYYGQITDISADPVNVENVYYDYDQVSGNNDEGQVKETESLRLVKRGKETHGPDGSMNIIRSQIKFMESLKSESKVLKAILNYEK